METLKKEILTVLGAGNSAKALVDVLNANGWDVTAEQVRSALRALEITGHVSYHRKNGFWSAL